MDARINGESLMAGSRTDSSAPCRMALGRGSSAAGPAESSPEPAAETKGIGGRTRDRLLGK